ncbi:MAG: RsmB/NOP family class I SAM-dependent RNA methyltransferase [Deltaproteobacteria bacterium]|nr:RsmB/NOP family class I SAM-dependent RNA methyltransferase [Deltaproteobacteria bacterium]
MARRRNERRPGSGGGPVVVREDAQPTGPRSSVGSRSGARARGRTDDRVLEAFAHVESGVPADRAVRSVFARAKDLGSKERALVSDTVFGMVRHRRQLDDRLERAAKADRKRLALLEAPLRNRLRLLSYLAMAEGADAKTLLARDPRAFDRIAGLFERLAAGRLARPNRSPEEELAVTTSLPDWLARRLIGGLGLERATDLAKALLERAPVTLRVNRLRMDRSTAQAEIKAAYGIDALPTTMSPDGLILPKAVDLAAWPLYEAGAIELMDEGSQLIALATEVRPGEHVLDACAGAGGKALALGAMMKNEGRIVALDPERQHLDKTSKRAERAGLTCLTTQCGDLMALGETLIGKFDCVLVDAPCTGTGTLRRSPDIKWRLNDEDVSTFASLQVRLLAAAARAVKPGGRLVYATCSVLREENESVVEALLATDNSIGVRPTPTTQDLHFSRIGPGPSERDPDGFFVSILHKAG